jgi:hypothetical protein
MTIIYPSDAILNMIHWDSDYQTYITNVCSRSYHSEKKLPSAVIQVSSELLNNDPSLPISVQESRHVDNK